MKETDSLRLGGIRSGELNEEEESAVHPSPYTSAEVYQSGYKGNPSTTYKE